MAHTSSPAPPAVSTVKLAPNAGVLGDNTSGVLVPKEMAPRCSSAKFSRLPAEVSPCSGASSSSNSLRRSAPLVSSSGLCRVKLTRVIWRVSTSGVEASSSKLCTMRWASRNTIELLMGGDSGVASMLPGGAREKPGASRFANAA